MATRSDFSFFQTQRGTLRIILNPPQPIGGWNIEWYLGKRAGGLSGTVHKYVNSGYNNVSGINLQNSGQGIFDISIDSVDTSGRDPGNYYYRAIRLGSGLQTQISYGYMKLLPF